MRRQEWPDGKPVKVFVLADRNPIHQAFSISHLGLFPYQLRKGWDRLVFSGTGEAPIEVKTIEQMREKVSSITGAIGYIPPSMIDRSVKALKVKQQ